MRKRTIKKNIWLNYEEDRQLKKLSSLLNLSEANVIRRLLFETSVNESPPKDFYDAIEKINKIGININQLTKIANSTNQLYVAELNHNLNALNNFITDLRKRYL